MDNAIPICRSVFKHWVYEDAEYFKVWFTMLADASYSLEPKMVLYEKVLIEQKYGEFIFGYKKWSKKCNISYQRLRGLMDKLVKAEMIRLKTQTNHFSLYEITNYSKFNSQQTQTEQGLEGNLNSQVTVRQQSGNSQATTTKKVKKEKKEKNTYAEFVKMTSVEYQKLVDAHGEEATKQMIDILDNYKGSKGKTYTDDYRAILSWVVKRYEEDRAKQPKQDMETERRKRQAIELDRRNGLQPSGNGKSKLLFIQG